MTHEVVHEPYGFGDREQRELCGEIIQELIDKYGTRTSDQRTDLKYAMRDHCPYTSKEPIGLRIWQDVFARLMNGQSALLADAPKPAGPVGAKPKDTQQSLF